MKYFTERLEDRGVIDGGKEKLYFFYIHIVLSNSLFKFDLILASSLGLSKIDVCLVDKDKHMTVVGIFKFEVFIDIVESITSLGKIR